MNSILRSAKYLNYGKEQFVSYSSWFNYETKLNQAEETCHEYFTYKPQRTTFEKPEYGPEISLVPPVSPLSVFVSSCKVTLP
jgi:hypothetical protein